MIWIDQPKASFVVTWVHPLYHLSNRIRKWLHVLYFFLMITFKTLFTSLGVLCAAHKKIHCSVAVICVQVEGVQSDWRKNNQHVLYELGQKLLSLAKSYSKRHCPLVVCIFSTLSFRYLFVLAKIIHKWSPFLFHMANFNYRVIQWNKVECKQCMYDTKSIWQSLSIVWRK